MEKMEAYFSQRKIPYRRVQEDDFIKYMLVYDSRIHVNLQIWHGINSNKGYCSIYVNEHGDYIHYELYEKEDEFIADVDTILQAKVNLQCTIQEGKIIEKKYTFIYPYEIDMTPYSVYERIQQGSLLKRKSYMEQSLQPWIA